MRLALVLLLVLGCSKKEEAIPDAPAADPDARVAAPAVDTEPEPESDVYGPVERLRRRTFRVTVRSTPPGADVAVDGRPLGTAPVIAEVLDDGKPRDFTFSLPGHKMARYRLFIVKDGVVHGTLKPLPYQDAGP